MPGSSPSSTSKPRGSAEANGAGHASPHGCQTVSTLTSENASHHGHHSAGLLVLLAFVDCAPLALRTRFPLSAWASSAAALIWTSLVIPPGSLGGPDFPAAGAFVYVLCLYR